MPPRDPSASPRPDPRPSAAVAAALPAVTGRAVVLGLVIVTLLISLSVPVRAWFTQRAQLASLRDEVAAAQVRVEELKRQRAQWDDPTFIAAQARTRLHFVLPGEVGYVALGLPADVAAAQAVAPPPDPWYSSLWSSMQQADDHAPAAPTTTVTTTTVPTTTVPTTTVPTTTTPSITLPTAPTAPAPMTTVPDAAVPAPAAG